MSHEQSELYWFFFGTVRFATEGCLALANFTLKMSRSGNGPKQLLNKSRLNSAMTNCLYAAVLRKYSQYSLIQRSCFYKPQHYLASNGNFFGLSLQTFFFKASVGINSYLRSRWRNNQWQCLQTINFQVGHIAKCLKVASIPAAAFHTRP